MQLITLDWLIIAATLLLSIIISLLVSKKSSKSSDEFFLSGRSLPWWLLGMSMVATTFSTDTPNLVADITRTQGVAGNWTWWIFLITGTVTTFFFSKLWRRSGVVTDIEFYELRYSGKTAAFLRVFRAVYLGLVFNVMIMAAVTLAAIKFGSVLLGLSPMYVVLIAGGMTLAFSIIGGLRGVIYTDLFLFGFAMIGAFAAAYFALQHPQVQSLDLLFSNEVVASKSAIFPSPKDLNNFVPLLLIPLLVQWWSVWYPGSEPGGGGYVAQRMLAAKDEDNALGAVLFFNFVHYAVRPWPWIIVALASLIVFPDLASIQAAFPDIPENVIGHDLAYPAMLSFVPPGWLGVIVASLLAAYMSTISTSLNLGSSYFTSDVYRRFVKPDATEKQLVLFGRIIMVILMFCAAFMALQLSSAFQAFNILLSIGAGTGLLFLLRWYWDRINAWSEISAMIISFVASLVFQFGNFDGLENWEKLCWSVGITTIGWVAVTFMTPKTAPETLADFYNKIQPPGPGWEKTKQLSSVVENKDIKSGSIKYALLCVISSTLAIYGCLFGVGMMVMGNLPLAILCALIAVTGLLICYKSWKKAEA